MYGWEIDEFVFTLVILVVVLAILSLRRWKELRNEITKRKRAEETLWESEERFRTISEIVSDYAYVLRVEPNGWLVREWVSEAITRITGYTLEELNALNGWLNLVHPEDREIVNRHRQAFKSGQENVSEYRIITKSGELRWLCDYSRPVWDEAQGRVVRAIGAAQDITERKRAEEELRKYRDHLEELVKERTSELVTVNEQLQNEIIEHKRAEKKLKESMVQIGRAKKEWESTADSLSYVVCLLDDQGRIVRVNRTVELWNLGRVVDVKGRGLHELFHPECTDPACYLKTFLSRAWEEVAQGRSAECEAEDKVLRRYLNVQVRPISAQTDEGWEYSSSFAVGSVNDITERKRTEEQIQAALKEKEVLLLEIHHRVKNNLQVISSLLDMSSLRTHDQQAIDLLTDARARIHTMALIHSQLYQSKRFDQIDMESHIRELVSYLSAIYAERKRITPRIEVSGVYLSLTQAIPCALILNELISNAFKHAFKEGQEGTIEVTMQQSTEDTIVLRVKDDGIGIRDDIDIYQTDSLGLKLVRRLVQKQLKGEIQVERDSGTEFIITFKILSVSPVRGELVEP